MLSFRKGADGADRAGDAGGTGGAGGAADTGGVPAVAAPAAGPPALRAPAPTLLEEASPVDTAILDSAARTVVDLGASRLTIAEVARRAGVSRPTVYRRWSGVEEMLAALLTREILRITADLPPEAHDRADLVDHVVDITWQLGAHRVLHTVMHESPEVFRTYVLTRLGSSQRALIDVLAGHIAHLQDGGAVRAGAPDKLAAMVLLIAQSAMQSAQAVAPILDADSLSGELRHALNGYLAP